MPRLRQWRIRLIALVSKITWSWFARDGHLSLFVAGALLCVACGSSTGNNPAGIGASGSSGEGGSVGAAGNGGRTETDGRAGGSSEAGGGNASGGNASGGNASGGHSSSGGSHSVGGNTSSDNAGGSNAGGDAVLCPATPLASGSQCSAQSQCTYLDCSGAGQVTVNCNGSGSTASVETLPCGPVRCGGVFDCAAGEICVIE
ncbi:MAG TPA: hypothetical protein VER96_24270, partial [Polyangiaceae bacterium]|nr:hypothetical protein [Polyangiaceae bacterium]